MIKTPFIKPQVNKHQNTRLGILVGFTVVLTVAIVVRLFMVQILDHDYYTALAAGQHQLYEKLVPKRGKIFIRDNNNNLFPLAENKELYLVFVVPDIIEDKEGTAKKLAEILNVEIPSDEKIEEINREIAEEEPAPEEEEPEIDDGVIADARLAPDTVNIDYKEMLRRISKEGDKYEPIVRRLTRSKADLIAESKMKGVRLQPEDWRYYPENSLASQTLGFVGFIDDEVVGSYGIEGFFNEILEGEDGFISTERDTAGRWISIGNKNLVPAKNGAEIILTLDRGVQYKTEETAQFAYDRWKAEEVSILVTDPMSGKILGMANYPTFNSNEYGQVEDASDYANSVIADVFEPGSIFKPIIMAAGVDAGVVEPDSTYWNSHSLKINGFTISNVDQSRGGTTTMTEVLERSLNTGMVHVMNELGRERAYEYLKGFGFDTLTGITMDREEETIIQTPDTWSDAQLGTIGFGQGIATTSLHVATAMGALANGGKLMQPLIVDEIRHPNGTVEEVAPKIVGEPISNSASLNISAMLVSSMENGFAETAKVDGYRLAGKTGTAQVAVDGSYNNRQKITSFVGYGPVDDPRFLILVKIVNPAAGQFGTDTAAPTFKGLAEFLINYYRIPPS